MHVDMPARLVILYLRNIYHSVNRKYIQTLFTVLYMHAFICIHYFCRVPAQRHDRSDVDAAADRAGRRHRVRGLSPGPSGQDRSHPGSGRSRQGSDQRHMYPQDSSGVGGDASRRRAQDHQRWVIMDACVLV